MFSNESLNTEIVSISRGENDSTNDHCSIANKSGNYLISSDEDSDSEKPSLENKFGPSMLALIATTVFTVNKFEPLPLLEKFIKEDTFTPYSLSVTTNPFTDKKCIFIPDVPIYVKVSLITRDDSMIHMFKVFYYKIKFVHGRFKWRVKRTYSQIKDTQRSLIKMIEKNSDIDVSKIKEQDFKSDWPLFPLFHDHIFRNEQDSRNKCDAIQAYLTKLLNTTHYRTFPSVLRLIGVSHMSFLNEISSSIIEYNITKRFYDNVYYGNCRFFKRIWVEYFKAIRDNRWVIVKDTYITYLNPKRPNYIGYVLIIDNAFECIKKSKPGVMYGLSIKSLQRTLFLKFKNKWQRREWQKRINIDLKKQAIDYINDNEYHSFAPQRKSQFCRWYVNSAGYMEDVMHAINHAKEEIFITDWWMCPEIYLKRPDNDLNFRLDHILLKKAKEGVKIYILLFKEVKFAIGLLSGRVKRILTENGQNPNIRVLRHPLNSNKDILNMTMWSHHEKVVIIDQKIAFGGGIDLCYGRYDDEEHRLVDLGDIKNQTEILTNIDHQTQQTAETEQLYKMFDTGLKNAIRELTNNTITIISQMDQNDDNNNNKKTDVLSDNDIALDNKPSSRKKIKNKIVRKFHRLKKKTYRNPQDNNDDTSSSSSSSSSDDEGTKSPRGYFSDFDENSSALVSNNNEKKGHYWKGKDYLNTFIEDTKEPEKFDEDQYDRKLVHRMPWRDEGFVLFGQSARDLARHFIQRWNHAKYELAYNNDFYSYLLPKEIIETNEKPQEEWFKKSLSQCSVQITRSLSGWSGGICKTEMSIHNAYIDLIDKAEHYIYIENQFFVTTCNPSKDNVCKNEIGLALFNRISRAHEKKESFKVYVVLPLFPGFDNRNAIRAVQYYNMRSIKLGQFSLFKQLEIAGIDPNKYITFHGMRNWSILMGKLVQEIIYVHSKLMIVDDKYVICGSANINDRSLLGKRDSEIAAVITDEEFLDSKLNNKKVRVGRYAFTLRKKIFKLHLGIYKNNLYKINVDDCATDEFFKAFRTISKQNTNIYDEVFKCSPSDVEKTFSEWRLHMHQNGLSKTNPEKGKKQLEEGVCGFIVDFPLEFLSKEGNFLPDFGTAENLMPTDLWV